VRFVLNKSRASQHSLQPDCNTNMDKISELKIWDHNKNNNFHHRKQGSILASSAIRDFCRAAEKPGFACSGMPTAF